MSAPAFTPGGNPYPDEELSLPEALAELDRREAAGQPVPTFTPRQPGATLPEQPPAAHPETDLSVLQRVADGLQPLPAPVRAGSKPSVNLAAVRGMLISGLWDAACWYGGLSGSDCTECTEGSPCPFHAERQGKAAGYEELYDLTVMAPGDGDALAGVIAAIRAGTAETGDLASLGSPLAGILGTALTAAGGAR